jgi:hypothetical protein
VKALVVLAALVLSACGGGDFQGGSDSGGSSGSGSTAADALGQAGNAGSSGSTSSAGSGGAATGSAGATASVGGAAPGFAGFGNTPNDRCDYISVCGSLPDACSFPGVDKPCGRCSWRQFSCGSLAGFYVSDGSVYVCSDGIQSCDAADDQLSNHCASAACAAD